MPSASDKFSQLFSWVHLSDLHLLQPPVSASAHQALIFNELCIDLERSLPQWGRVGSLIITGDLAYSGARKNAQEYKHTAQLVERVQSILTIGKGAVFMVPGNHDIDLDQHNRNLERALVGLRRGDESIDDVLTEPDQKSMFCKRQEPYVLFSKDYGPPETHSDPSGFWSTRFYAGKGTLVRICGFNTSLLSDKGGDKGALQLGNVQLAEAFKEPISNQEIVISLSHHPLRGGWLQDERAARDWIYKKSHIHLSGHVHEQRISTSEKVPSGSPCVLLSAGAAHDSTDPRVLGYLVCQIWLKGDEVVLRVYPRIWSLSKTAFVADSANCEDGLFYADFPISKFANPQLPKNSDIRTLETYSVLASGIYPISLKGLSPNGIARIVEHNLDVHVEMVWVGSDSLDIVLRAPNSGFSTHKKYALSVAVLLSTTEMDEIRVGFYNTESIDEVSGMANYPLVKFWFPTANVKEMNFAGRPSRDFWSKIYVYIYLPTTSRGVKGPVPEIQRKIANGELQ